MRVREAAAFSIIGLSAINRVKASCADLMQQLNVVRLCPTCKARTASSTPSNVEIADADLGRDSCDDVKRDPVPTRNEEQLARFTGQTPNPDHRFPAPIWRPAVVSVTQLVRWHSRSSFYRLLRSFTRMCRPDFTRSWTCSWHASSRFT